MRCLILMSFGVVKLLPSVCSKLRGRRSTAGKTPGLGGAVTLTGGRCEAGASFAPTHLASQAAR